MASKTAVIVLISMALMKPDAENPCDLNLLPEQVKTIIENTFSDWRPWDLSDLTEEERRVWDKRRAEQLWCPGIAIGNFDHAASVSYAFSLVPREPADRGWRLIVIRKNESGEYEHISIRERDDLTGTGFLYKVPPGRYEDVYESQSVLLSLDGFRYETVGKGAMLFYSEAGVYRKLLLFD